MTGHETNANQAGEVAHLSALNRIDLRTALGGSEPEVMTPAILSHIEILNEQVLCRFDADSVEAEVNILGRSLDLLASAELPESGEEIQVAIENQYGTADPDHFGRLIGWYMPETGARMGVLIAEGFEPQLIRAVSEGEIVRPEHGLWLVEATAYQVDSTRFVNYQTRASSLPRAERLSREKAFLRGTASSSAEDDQRARKLFEWIQRTSDGWIGEAIARSRTKSGYYRRLQETTPSIFTELFVGTDRISIGSSHTKSGHSAEQLELIEAANKETEVDPSPARRYLRGSWWDLRTDIGRNSPEGDWPEALGAELERAYEAVSEGVRRHQSAMNSAAELAAGG